MLPDVQTLALTCFLLLGAGYCIQGILFLIPRFSEVARRGLPLMLSETLIVGLFAGAFWVGWLVLDLALVALVFRCAWEAASIARLRHPGARLSPLHIAGGAVALALLASLLPIVLLCGLLILVAGIGKLSRYSNALSDNADVTFLRNLILFPGTPLILFAAAGLQKDYGSWLMIAFILVETFDSYALAGGWLFGRTKAFPTLSPRKTVEGLVIGAIALMLTAAIAGAIFGLPVPASAAIALLVGALAVTGDLAASTLKRRSNVKDFPTVLRQQGGLLDIGDAWITAGAGLAAFAALSGLA